MLPDIVLIILYTIVISYRCLPLRSRLSVVATSSPLSQDVSPVIKSRYLLLELWAPG